MSKRELVGRLARWSLSLQEWNLTIVYRSGKLHTNADCLSRYPIESEKPIEGDDLDGTDRCLIAPIGLNTLSMELSTSDEIIMTVVKLLQRGKTSGRYQLVGGLLHIQTRIGEYNRLCVPPLLRPKVLEAFHDSVLAGHLGQNRTLQKIKLRYFGPS